MNPQSNSRTGGREAPAAAKEVDTKHKKAVPNADMQAEDAGTADSGAGGDGGTAVDSAMKETSKTDSESGR